MGVCGLRGPLVHSDGRTGYTMSDLGKASAYIALFSEIGFVLLIAVLGGVLAGYWLDQRLNSVPLFVLVGFGLGTAGGSIASWRLINRFLAQLGDDEKR
jgi:F0F1-type ATP synthase assembly protein I